MVTVLRVTTAKKEGYDELRRCCHHAESAPILNVFAIARRPTISIQTRSEKWFGYFRLIPLRHNGDTCTHLFHDIPGREINVSQSGPSQLRSRLRIGGDSAGSSAPVTRPVQSCLKKERNSSNMRPVCHDYTKQNTPSHSASGCLFSYSGRNHFASYWTRSFTCS